MANYFYSVTFTHSLQTAKPADSKVSGILQNIVYGSDGSRVQLVEQCRQMLKGQYYGGQLVDTAVNAIFAALIWNSQDCREELDAFGKGFAVFQLAFVLVVHDMNTKGHCI